MARTADHGQRQELVDRFERFFRNYYEDAIAELAQRYPSEQRSLRVDWRDLYRFDPDLADDYLEQPDQLREHAERALGVFDLPVDVALEDAHVRVYNLDASTEIRAIRARDVNTLVSVQGIVRKATDVRPKIQEAAFECQRCGTLTYIPQHGDFQEPHECQGCERQGPFQINYDQSTFIDAQTLRVQERPEGLRGGETPQSIDVNVEDDIAGRVSPGDYVTVTGVLRIDQQESGGQKTRVFDVYMDGHSITLEDEAFEEMDIREADKEAIVELAQENDIYERMVGAIAPSIYGFDNEKLAIAMQLFSGVTKELPDDSRIRGDIHILLIGDPGTGKSQILQYIQQISPRGVYTSGKGSSAAGLTAAAVQSDFGDGQSWTLEAGALVLADKGMAAIDELDKMADDDRSAMHEALEQQSYHPDTEVLLADGQRIEIGKLVDDRLADRLDEVVEGVDCEILPTEDIGVHTVDLDTNTVEKAPVDRISRHEAPDEFVRVTFSNGRSVTVTPEHPMFVERDGEVETIEARTIEEGIFVPAPRKLPNSTQPVDLTGEPHVGKEKDIDLPESLSPTLAEVLGFLVAEGHSYAGSAHEIGFSNQDERLLDRMAELMGTVFGMESSDTTNDEGTVTKRWVSTKLYRWFETNFPEIMETARDKRIPAKVLGASEEHIRRFLVGAFAGDGGVESEAMAFATSSEGLAEDYADALAKIGVASRIHYNSSEDAWKTYVMGDSTERFVDAVVEPDDDRHDRARDFAERSTATRRHHDVLPPSAARELRALKRLLGVPLDGTYRKHLDEGYGIQIETVEAEIGALRERAAAIERELDTATTLAAVRSASGWSGREVADRIGTTTSAVHYAENGGYDGPKRAELTARAKAAVGDALAEFEARADALEDRCDLRYYRVTDVETVPNEGEAACEWVYDVTVEPTNTFVSQGVVLHNSISISKAGITATLKSRCALLGAANPKYGRFDEYEPIAEQIELDPALISRFDLIFTVTDQPDEERDAALADHILRSNYAGELNTQHAELASPGTTDEELAEAARDVDPTIDPDLLRKYVAYAKRNVFPRMTDEARQAIRDFYVDLRAQGTGEDAPVPITARKLEALVRLAEASARIRLSDTVERSDAERVIEIVQSSLQDIGVDPETGEFDADIIETEMSKSQRDRVKTLKALIDEIEDEFEDGAPVDEIKARADEADIDAARVDHEIEKLKQKGELYEPRTNYLRTT